MFFDEYSISVFVDRYAASTWDGCYSRSHRSLRWSGIWSVSSRVGGVFVACGVAPDFLASLSCLARSYRLASFSLASGFSACCLRALLPLPGLLRSDPFLFPSLRILHGLLAVSPVLLGTLLASGLPRDGWFLCALGAEAVLLSFVPIVLSPESSVLLPVEGLTTRPVVILGIGLRSCRGVRLSLVGFL